MILIRIRLPPQESLELFEFQRFSFFYIQEYIQNSTSRASGSAPTTPVRIPASKFLVRVLEKYLRMADTKAPLVTGLPGSSDGWLK